MGGNDAKQYKVVFLFSGQGSHYRQMGQPLFENNDVFRRSIEKSETIIHEYLGKSLINELYNSKNEVFDDVLITHPAIVSVEIAMLNVMQDMGITADYYSGSSLGEFSAGVAGGVWNHETALVSSIKQAEFIIDSTIQGGMLAVIDQKDERIKEKYLEYNLFLASDNFEGHFTLSGSVVNLDAYQKVLQQQGAQFFRLPVNVPFHSPYLINGLKGFTSYMDTIHLKIPKPGFISGIKNKTLSSLPQKYFGDVVSLYSNFPTFVSNMENIGPCLYIDLGPSGTSATFVKYNLDQSSNSKTVQIMTPFKQELSQLNKLKDTLDLI